MLNIMHYFYQYVAMIEKQKRLIFMSLGEITCLQLTGLKMFKKLCLNSASPSARLEAILLEVHNQVTLLILFFI